VQPPSDRAYVYVYRNEGMANVLVGIWLDGVRAGSTSRRTFAFFQVRAGRHAVVSGSKDGSELTLHVLGGEVVYLKHEVSIVPVGAVSPLAGLLVGNDNVLTELQRVSRAEGRAGVRECRLIRDPPPPLPRVAKPDESVEIPLTAGPGPQPRP